MGSMMGIKCDNPSCGYYQKEPNFSPVRDHLAEIFALVGSKCPKCGDVWMTKEHALFMSKIALAEIDQIIFVKNHPILAKIINKISGSMKLYFHWKDGGKKIDLKKLFTPHK